MQTFVGAVALYGKEAQTTGKTGQKRVEAFEIWCWRRMLVIKWTGNVRNEEVFGRVGEERTL
jgi:hypothetical protein